MKFLKILGVAALPIAALSLTSCNADEFRTVLANQDAWMEFDVTGLRGDITDLIQESKESEEDDTLNWNTADNRISDTAEAIKELLIANIEKGNEDVEYNIFRNNVRYSTTDTALPNTQDLAWETLTNNNLNVFDVTINSSGSLGTNFEVVVTLAVDANVNVAGVTLLPVSGSGNNEHGLLYAMGFRASAPSYQDMIWSTSVALLQRDIQNALRDALDTRAIVLTDRANDADDRNAIAALILDVINSNLVGNTDALERERITANSGIGISVISSETGTRTITMIVDYIPAPTA